MKTIEKMTEQEVLALTDDQIQTMIKLRKAEEGIKFITIPEKPTLTVIPKPSTKIYFCELLGKNISFKSIDELNAMIELLEASSVVSVEQNYDYMDKDGYKYYILPELKKQGYSREPWTKITSEDVYTTDEYRQIKSVLADNKKLSDNYEKLLKEYNDSYDSAKWIESEIWEKVNEVRGKYYNLDLKCVYFKRDYLPLSENDEEVAMRFMVKAYNLTEEEQKYILDNYKDTKN